MVLNAILKEERARLLTVLWHSYFEATSSCCAVSQTEVIEHFKNCQRQKGDTEEKIRQAVRRDFIEDSNIQKINHWYRVKLIPEVFWNLVFHKTPAVKIVCDLQTKKSGKESRLLNNVARIVVENPNEVKKHGYFKDIFEGYRSHVEKALILRQVLHEPEKREGGQYYIHDGNHRALAYAVKLLTGNEEYKMVQAYLGKVRPIEYNLQSVLAEVEAILPQNLQGNFITKSEKSDVVHNFLACLAKQTVEMDEVKQRERKGFLEWLENVEKALRKGLG